MTDPRAATSAAPNRYPHTTKQMSTLATLRWHSTRLMGFHVRNHNCADGAETPMYTATIYHDDKIIGFARNAGDGGEDLVQIHRQHRNLWATLENYIARHPFAVEGDGSPAEGYEQSAAIMALLRTMDSLERSLQRRRKYNSAFLAHKWATPSPSARRWVTPVEVFFASTSVHTDVLDPHLFWIIRVGVDNPHFERDAPYPPLTQATTP